MYPPAVLRIEEKLPVKSIAVIGIWPQMAYILLKPTDGVLFHYILLLLRKIMLGIWRNDRGIRQWTAEIRRIPGFHTEWPCFPFQYQTHICPGLQRMGIGSKDRRPCQPSQ